MFLRPEKYGLKIPDRYWYESTGWMDRPVCETSQLTHDQIKQWVHRCYFEFCSGLFGGEESTDKTGVDFGMTGNASLRSTATDVSESGALSAERIAVAGH
jgi:hypothetical protein